MKTQSYLQKFEFNSTPIQVVGSPETPLFVAKDVCTALGYVEENKALRKLDDDEKLPGKIYRSGQHRTVMCVNEAGLYTLMLRSTKPEAKAFKRWVTHEVLPAIRKTGGYGAAQQVPASKQIPQPEPQNGYLVEKVALLEEIVQLQKQVLAQKEKPLKVKKTIRPVTDAERELILDLRTQGVTYNEIARRSGRARSVVQYQLRKMGDIQ
jgi:prophage antirepressor-like protein